MVWKLLRQHISISQMVGFFLANLCGMVILLLGIQFYSDITPLFTRHDSFMGKDYVILTRKISALGSLVGRDSSFSPAEIEGVRRQPFTREVGIFRPAQFHVSAGMGFQGIGFSTAMFFESVPDHFLDVRPDEWRYTSNQSEIPIILPRNYLNLYNFGFARTRNMPQLSEGMVGMVALDIKLTGNGRTDLMKGRVVGFTNRLNTILVPEEFMNWANSHYGSGTEKQASRLIVEVDNPADDRIAKFVKENGYEVEGDKLDAGKSAWFLKLIIGAVMAVGAVICVLSLYILMLSIFLLLQKNSKMFENLLLIGYSPLQIALPYQLLAVGLNLAVWILAVWMVGVAKDRYADLLGELLNEFTPGSLLMTAGCGAVLFIIASALNVLLIYRKVAGMYHQSAGWKCMIK